MKGLLLKDFYAIRSYFRTLLIVAALCALIPCISGEATFFLFYSCVFSGMIGTSLISTEDSEKWAAYAATLPYTRAQIVSEKYILCLIIGGLGMVYTILTQAVNMVCRSAVDVLALGELAMMMCSVSLLPAAILFPLIYKLGAEKGRFAFTFVFGAFCGLIAIVCLAGAQYEWDLVWRFLGAVLLAVSVVAFGLS